MDEDLVAMRLRVAPDWRHPPAAAIGGGPGSTTVLLPRLAPTFRLVPDGETLRLRSGRSEFAIDHAPSWARPFVCALDGEHEVASVVDALRSAGFLVTFDEVNETVAQLAELGLIEDATHDRLLDDRNRERYDRQLRYFAEDSRPGESGVHRQLRLKDAHVAVLGLGALGGHIAVALAAAGVGTIAALDGDVVELSNLNRQTLYGESDIGRPKADVARERICGVNSTVAFTAERGWLESQRDVERAIAGADFVVDAVDSPPGDIERWVNDACFSLGVPYVGMSHDPPWIRVGPTYVPGETGCYRCQEVDWRARDPLFDAASEGMTPAATASTALAVAGMVSMEVIHYLTGIAPPASLDTAVLIDLRTLSIERSPIVRQADCAVCQRSS